MDSSVQVFQFANGPNIHGYISLVVPGYDPRMEKTVFMDIALNPESIFQ